MAKTVFNDIPSKGTGIRFILAIAAIILILPLMRLTPWQDKGIINPDAVIMLPNYYMNGMVFQREKTIHVKGTTEAGTRLEITIGDNARSSSATTVADDNGIFTANLETPPARLEAYSLTVSSGNNTLLTIAEVYVGDVFLAAGQSNMEANYYDYYKSSKKTDSINSSNLPSAISNPNVHFIVASHVSSSHAESRSSNIPLRSYCSKKWLTATGTNSDFLGYLPQFFAEHLSKKNTNIPIGIIQTAWSGTSISQHLDNGKIYNTHIAPLKDFSIAGILWYQGETDAIYDLDSYRYLYNFALLIQQYRQLFNDEDLPFLFVQLARYSDNRNTTIIRQAQLDVLSIIQHPETVAMTVSIDTDKGTQDNIHPLGKDILGTRMADQWVAMRLHTQIPSGPIIDKARSARQGTSASISFTKHTAQDLHVMSPIRNLSASPQHYAVHTSNQISGFEAAGSDGVFHKATATVNEDDTLTITSKGVDHIQQVRYLWSNSPQEQTLLYNKWNLPASPFVIDVS